jgi:phenylalanyl-tRNA synthetase beta chain
MAKGDLFPCYQFTKRINMPTITFEFNDLIQLIDKKVDKDSIIKVIERIGGEVGNVYGNSMDVEFLPNRPDLYSAEGVARAVKSFLTGNGLYKYNVKKSDIILKVEKTVKNVRPFIVGGLVKNVKFTESAILSLMNLQEKLHLTLGRNRKKVSIGVHDFSKVKPPFVYKGVKPKTIRFIPLAKTKEMSLDEILEIHEKGIAYAGLLKGFDRYPVLMDSENNVLSFPPIINGALTTVTENTKDVFVDVTGVDFKAINYALNIVCTALAEREGEIYSVSIFDDKKKVTPDLKTKTKRLGIEYINSMLGMELKEKEVVSSLKKMGFDANINNGNVDVLIPAYRTDILHQIDLVEDVAIGYGYEKFSGTLPKALTFGKYKNVEKKSEELRKTMIGLGFNEVTTLTLSSEKNQFEKMGINEENKTIIKNPISEEHTILRVSLLPGLLNILNINKHRSLPLKVFEIGDVIVDKKNVRKIGGVITHSKANFTEIKSIVEGILREMKIKHEIKPKTIGYFIDGRCASVLSNKKEICYFGELHPKVITNFELGNPVTCFEMRLN